MRLALKQERIISQRHIVGSTTSEEKQTCRHTSGAYSRAQSFMTCHALASRDFSQMHSILCMPDNVNMTCEMVPSDDELNLVSSCAVPGPPHPELLCSSLLLPPSNDHKINLRSHIILYHRHARSDDKYSKDAFHDAHTRHSLIDGCGPHFTRMHLGRQAVFFPVLVERMSRTNRKVIQ